LRAFVAVELDDACRCALQAAIEKLRPVAGGIRWVKPGSLHLTLKFIGDLAEADLPRAVECLQQVAASACPFTMSASGLSGFPPRGIPRVVHVGLQEPTGVLGALQQAVERGLAEALGIAPEKRRFVPHITLGRTKDRRRCPRMDEIEEALESQDFGEVRVDSFVLMRSDLRPDGAVYTVLHRFALAAEGEVR
jgi:2'-5' RNA ligase